MISRIQLAFAPLLMAVSVACSGDRAGNTADTAVEVTITPTLDSPGSTPAAGPLTLSAADIEGFEKGIAREAELVKEAQARSRTASTPEARGEAIQAAFEQNT